jgi:hypothetical protein
MPNPLLDCFSSFTNRPSQIQLRTLFAAEKNLKNSFSQDFLAALSLANLCFIALWDGLLNFTPDQAFFFENPPPGTAYVAAFANVIFMGSVFFLLIRLARWIAARYGGAGFVLGSLPILLLIALPAGKSTARLLADRIPDADPPRVIAVLAFVLGATAAIARRHFFKLVSAVLVTISPLILVEAILSISKCRTDRSAEFAHAPLAPRLPAVFPRIVWIIFDELDYRLAFPDRPSNVAMPEFDRLREESLFAEHAISPAPDTVPSVPSLLIGKVIPNDKSLAAALLRNPTIFSSAHAAGANAAVVGWHLPYCRLFAQDLAACSSHNLENELSETDKTFMRSLVLEQESLFAYGYRSLLGESPRLKYRIWMLNAMHADALRDVADSSLNLVFLHLPVPHAPYLYDRFSHTFPRLYLGTSTYLDNLALTDLYLGDLRAAMTTAGLWDKTTVLVTSDHPNRSSMSVDGKSDPRVPFLLKLAGQISGLTYRPILRTVVTKSLLVAILNREITTPEEATLWLTAQTK